MDFSEEVYRALESMPEAFSEAPEEREYELDRSYVLKQTSNVIEESVVDVSRHYSLDDIVEGLY